MDLATGQAVCFISAVDAGDSRGGSTGRIKTVGEEFLLCFFTPRPQFPNRGGLTGLPSKRPPPSGSVFDR